jgi:hypothetical protein
MEPQKNEQRQSGLTGLIMALVMLICFSFLMSCAPTGTEIPVTTEPPTTEIFATEPPGATESPSVSPTYTKMFIDITSAVKSPTPTGTEAVATTQPAGPPTLSPQEQLEKVDAELRNALQGNFTYTAPSAMKLMETFTIELLLNPSLSANELATQIVANSGLVTSTAEPGVLLTTSGGEVKIVGSQAEITPLMKAVLISLDPEAFDVQPIHDNEVQVVGKNSTTAWRWLITARKGGIQKLILVIYRQVKIDKAEYWRSVQAYRAEITVDVTLAQWLASLDWKWIVGVLITALLIPAFWRWMDRRSKQSVPPTKAKPGKTSSPKGKKPKSSSIRIF